MDQHKEEKIHKSIDEHQQNKKLTSSELGDLYANYIGDSLYCCMFEHQLIVAEDQQIKELLETNLEISKNHLKKIEKIFKQEQIPIPVGFGENDIRKDAPKLFSDVFMLFYLTQISRANMTIFSDGLGTATREDIINYFENCLEESLHQYKKSIHLLLEKGMDIAFPTIPYPKSVDFIEKENFTSFITGKKRPLTALEIKQLQVNINTNTLGKSLMLGFSQVASAEALRNYFYDGVQLADKQISQLGDMLMRENLPTPKLMDTHITDSTIAPFSDKLMLYHTFLANGLGIENYGSAISKVLRKDIHDQFVSLSAGIAKYSNKGLNIMIENGWLEEPPSCADREKLSKHSKGSK